LTQTSEEVAEITVQEENRKKRFFSLSFLNSIVLLLIIAFIGWMYFSIGPHLLSSNNYLDDRLVGIESEMDKISQEIDNTRGDYLSSSVYEESLGAVSAVKERVTLLESKVSELSNLTNDGTEGKDEQLEILIAFALLQSAEAEFNFFGRSEQSLFLIRQAMESLKGTGLPNNSPAFRELDRIEELIESTGTPAVSASYKRLSKITETLVEEIRKKQGASARALKPEMHTKSISEAVFDELKLLASVRVVPGKSSKELLAESGLIGEFFQTKELVFLVSKIQREVAENRLHEAGKTIGTLLVMLEDYPGDLSTIIEQVKEVENLLSKHEKVNFGPALTFISELLTRGR
jgi:hypothetical protein